MLDKIFKIRSCDVEYSSFAKALIKKLEKQYMQISLEIKVDGETTFVRELP